MLGESKPMIVDQEGYLLYIEPSSSAAEQPLVDELTRKMVAAFRQATKGTSWRGFHTCACGANSSNCDYSLPDGQQTNSLCVHYLAYHRSDVPESELAKVAALTNGEAEPTEEELGAPRRIGGYTTRSGWR